MKPILEQAMELLSRHHSLDSATIKYYDITALGKETDELIKSYDEQPEQEPKRVKVDSLASLAVEVHSLNHKWWHDEDGNRLELNKGELLRLIHSEVSEAMEGERKNLMDDKLPHRKMAEVELADALIRILDYAEGFGYDIDGAVTEKLEYNKTRADHTHEERNKEHGKKW